MLLIVVVVFIACWLPFVLYTGFIERWVAPFPNPSDGVRFVLYSIGLFNSVCNPAIYFFSSENFRKGSLKNVCLDSNASGEKNVHGNESQNTMSTRIKSRTLSKLSIVIPPFLMRERSPTEDKPKVSNTSRPETPDVCDTRL